MAKKQIEVVAAIIHDDKGRIFATQRGYGDYKDWWELPADLEVVKIYENAPNDQTKMRQITKRNYAK